VSGTCEVVHVNSYDVHTRSPKAPLQGCVRLASIAEGVHWSFSFRFENLNNSRVFRFLQARSLQNIANKFSYDLCTQSPHLPLSSMDKGQQNMGSPAKGTRSTTRGDIGPQREGRGGKE
jgi:hypothetical protein